MSSFPDMSMQADILNFQGQVPGHRSQNPIIIWGHSWKHHRAMLCLEDTIKWPLCVILNILNTHLCEFLAISRHLTLMQLYKTLVKKKSYKIRIRTDSVSCWFLSILVQIQYRTFSNLYYLIWQPRSSLIFGNSTLVCPIFLFGWPRTAQGYK